jgi:hypothetical protein
MPVSAKYIIYYASEQKKSNGADRVFNSCIVANNAEIINVFRNVCLGHPYSYNAGKCVACGLKTGRPSHVTIVLAPQLFTFTFGMRCLGHNVVWKCKLLPLTGLVGQMH